MSNRSASDWDPRDEAVLRDQRQAYDDMREQCPVAYSDYLGWSIFRHEDISRIIDDPETFSNASRRRAIPNGMDAPEHTVYRQILEPYFDQQRMAAFEPVCRNAAANLVQDLIDSDAVTVEFISQFAELYPLHTCCTWLGWPSDRSKQLRGWNHGNQQMAFTQDRDAGRALAAQFAGYVLEALESHRVLSTASSDDVTTDLLRTEVDGTPLSDDDIVSILRNWIAGHGTVAGGLGNVVHYLAQDLELQERLRREPAQIPTAIDEILRTDDPLVMNQRTTTRDVEIGGREIPAGERVTLMWVAANRDGRVFQDPDSVKLDRDQSANLVFGAGIHDCVGAPMARLELRVAVEELLARTSRIELSEAEPPVRAVVPSNGLQSLHVRLSR